MSHPIRAVRTAARRCASSALVTGLVLSTVSIVVVSRAAPAAAFAGTSVVSAGSGGFTCAVTSGGGAKCWGTNDSGQLGDGTTSNRETPVDVATLTSGVASVSAGTDHACALTTGGGVKCWGWNDAGQLGNGTLSPSPTPVNVSGLGSGVSAISAGGAFTCALTSGGGVKCWGSNSSGQLGDGTLTNRSAPVDVCATGQTAPCSVLLSGVTAISTGGRHACALLGTGAVKCWGSNGAGQLGDGTYTTSPTPVDVSGLGTVSKVSAEGASHSCAVTTGGGVKCWGSDQYGQLGDGTMTTSNTPVNVSGLGSGVSDVSAGGRHTCALKTGGAVKCWGSGFSGQLGNATRQPSLTPVATFGLSSGVTAVAAGDFFTCAITTGDGLQCWGNNSNGQLGNGTTTDFSIPDGVVGLSRATKTLAAGGNHSCAITSAGGVKCWGLNSSGQLGDGTTTNRKAPVPVSGLSSGVVQVAAGGSHTCALTGTGAVKCWGANASGQLGDGTKTKRLMPVTVSIGTVIAISAGSKHTCAVTSAGAVKCWGYDKSGQLGDGTHGDTSGTTPCYCRTSPVNVVGLSAGEVDVVAGGSHSCALSSGGTVDCWGSNASGQLGTGTTTSSTTPVGVVDLFNPVVQIVTGSKHSCALDDGGAVRCWGANKSGQLGNGTTTGLLRPVVVSGLGGSVESITAGNAHTCAVRITGSVKCWGSNGSGQIGDGSTTNALTDVGVSGLSSGGAFVAAGGSHTCAYLGSAGAISAVGGVLGCWGRNASGQLGDNSTSNSSTPVAVVGFP
jgi:alpha-tubulin suppressor-like RCC1 family protein